MGVGLVSGLFRVQGLGFRFSGFVLGVGAGFGLRFGGSASGRVLKADGFVIVSRGDDKLGSSVVPFCPF